MMQIHSVGRPVAARDVRVDDQIVVAGNVITVDHVIYVVDHDYRVISGQTIMGSWHKSFFDDEIVFMAEEQFLSNPATSAEIYLALLDKGAI